MEKKIDGKVKSVAVIPANYVSILQLRERWVKEKEQNQKEGDLRERGVKQIDDGHPRREKEEEEEDDVVKVVEAIEPGVNLEEKGLGGSFRMNRWKKERKCEQVEVSAIVRKKEEDGGDSRERKKKWSKKKIKTQGRPVEEAVKAYIPREKGETIVQNRENAARDSVAVETQLQDLGIKKRVEEKGREFKGPARLDSGQGYYRNQRHDWSSTRVIRATGSMVWVKKGENDGAGGGNGF